MDSSSENYSTINIEAIERRTEMIPNVVEKTSVENGIYKGMMCTCTLYKLSLYS